LSHPTETRRAISPKWVVAALLVVALTALFIRLGFWQLDRHAQRQEENRIGAERIQQEPVPLSSIIADTDLAGLRHRPVQAQGSFALEHEILVRSQVHHGVAGFHVVTPLVMGDGSAVLVNRGWVPLGADEAPIEEAAPPPGEVTVEGWVEPGQERPTFGPVDPEGRVVSRIDIARIGQQVPFDLAPFYLVAMGEEGALPEPVPTPAFDDNGPHLGYALQWFGFAATAVIGFALLWRKDRQASKARSGTTS
jgi:surfeit locus 1 family protein